jgi:hypothetical protein
MNLRVYVYTSNSVYKNVTPFVQLCCLLVAVPEFCLLLCKVYFSFRKDLDSNSTCTYKHENI